MSKNVLITGAYGFLGRYSSKYFSQLGYNVTGIGHGAWEKSEISDWGISNWISEDITLESLINIDKSFDIIVHCGGSGSVAFSLQEPKKDFERSVDTTLAVLEYIRKNNPKAKLIYPSSPAVQGIHENNPIKETDPYLPVSPYGFHKKVAEELCLSYAAHFKVDMTIIRFFSIYGPHLKKQLLWDASQKLSQNFPFAEFWGDGSETRDWIYIDDAVSLIYNIAHSVNNPYIINGGSGFKYTVSETLSILKNCLNSKTEIKFNNFTKEGDPKYYWADMSRIKSSNWSPMVSLDEGIKKYAAWFEGQK